MSASVLASLCTRHEVAEISGVRDHARGQSADQTNPGKMMAIEDSLDQLYALYVANSIITGRLWQYLGSVGAKAEGLSEAAFMEKHLKMSIESIPLWKVEGIRDPEAFRKAVEAQLRRSMVPSKMLRPLTEPLQ